MKSSLFFAAACSAVVLGGCVVAIGGDDDGFSTSYSNTGHGYGSVYAADVSANAISFTVKDNGCTDESFFEIDVRKADEDEFKVGLDRIRQDHCKAHNPGGKTISWSFQELGIPDGAEITVLNGVRR